MAALPSGRRTGHRSPKRTYLLVCEGEKTEVLYFKAFNRFGGDVRHLKVTSNRGDQMELVEEAGRLAREGNYDQVWCVFDCDGISRRKFDAVKRAADERGINIAYSNEAFEIWYMLHFDYVHSAVSRSEYAAKLTDKLGTEYRKNLPDMYERLARRQEQAIRNAARLLGEYDPVCPAEDNPSTTVHVLVRELLKNIK